ncbi:RHS repeat domain-containing protein [Lentimicrobium sp. S6]|nr:RHS repeat-associated core domain-containing protein [Lentimicrobium sp. S6]NPD44852.1 hypothetical protein [Lentimicrobium sp. S6]
MQLDYETGTNPQFNGNISSVSWSSEYYEDLKQYEFEYDALNRLTAADYAINAAYSTSYAYDKNGNISHLSRNGIVNETVGEIDDLFYAYNGNQLKRVTDFATGDYNSFGFNEGVANYTIDYDYDANGNMILDENKGISSISYNHLNLPTKINIERDESKQIKYIYTATGNKLRKQTIGNAAENITTDYVGTFVYETTNDLELQFIQTSEGRLVPNAGGGYNYEYALKDHLGNTRVMFSQTGDILQDQSYYPFGMSLGNELTYQNTTDSPKNKYLYNGKELQTDFELGWYDYGARFYDPQIARWHVIDPMYDRHYDWTPYAYVLNNPIINIDLYGFTDWKAIMKGSAMVVGGLTSVIGGVAMASTPTGVGQYAGGAAIVTGVPTMGVGIGMIAAGIKDDGTAQNIPTGPGETAGMAGDKLMGNENNELRNAGSALDLGINIATANPQTAIEEVALGVDIAISVDNIVNNDNSSTGTNTSSKQTTQSNSKSENGNGIDLVLGQHLKSSDPDYWNTLTNEQQTGYNQDRVDRYQQHLINDDK